jgi:DNA-binding MarR family transcriptional regulator
VSKLDQAHLADAVRTTVMRLSRELRRQAGTPFTATQLSVLGTIERAESISLGELAAREALSAPMISKVVAALEDAGVIYRSADRRDGRVCLVQVTEQGQEWLAAELVRWNTRLAERLAQLDRTEREALATAVPLLDRLASGSQ